MLKPSTPRSSVKPPGKVIVGAIPTQLTASRQKDTEMTMRPSIFCDGVRPSERP